MTKIKITSIAFEDGGKIPAEYTCGGKDVSPPLVLSEISNDAKSVAIIMDDIDHPLFGIYNHWAIWNLPATKQIPENIPAGKISDSGASQGIGYGRHKYRGPNPPFNASHAYLYGVYVLDTRLNLDPRSKKKDLLAAMDGHVLQFGSITGYYK